jgi:hypothetical protein
VAAMPTLPTCLTPLPYDTCRYVPAPTSEPLRVPE